MKREEGNTNSPELSLLKFLLLTYHHSHFLTVTLNFTSFFTMAFLGAAHFSYSLAVFGLDYSYLYDTKLIARVTGDQSWEVWAVVDLEIFEGGFSL